MSKPIDPKRKVAPVADAVSEALLLLYQSMWINDPAQVKIIEKSRRIGLSWGESSDSPLIAGLSAADGGMDCWYIGYNKDMAVEFIRDCATWARSYDFVCDTPETEIMVDKDKDILTFVIRFSSGFRITALSSRPSNLRGKQGVVIIDEAAFHDDLPGLMKSAMALLIWGGKVRVISTHNGEDNYFNTLIKLSRAGKLPYSVHRVTFRDALNQGLYKRICKMKGLEWSQEAEDEWVKGTYDFYGDDAAEELDVIPSQSSGAYIPRTVVERCQSAEAELIRFAVDDNFVTDGARIHKTDVWILDQLKPIIDNLDGVPTVFGQDFGRSGDLSVITVLQKSAAGQWPCRLMIELRNVPFDVQRHIIKWLLKNLPLFRHAKFDARGNGQSHAESAMQLVGAERADCVMASGGWYNEFFPKYKSALEEQSTTLPVSEDVIADHRRVVLVNGCPRMDDKRDKGSDGKDRHGDSAIAGVLAWAATLEEGEPAAISEVTPTPDQLADAYLPSRRKGKRRNRIFHRITLALCKPFSAIFRSLSRDCVKAAQKPASNRQQLKESGCGLV